ncbi:sugar phosphate isomerase/epimerase family protein [Enterococcus sp. LJL99]
MYNLTVRGHDLTNVSDSSDLAKQIADQKIHNVQFSLDVSFPELSAGNKLNPGMGTFFKQTFAKQEIQVALLSCYSNLIHPDPVKRENILQKFESYLAHAHYFGASMVASETGSVLPDLGYTVDNFQPAVFEDLVAVIRRLVRVGEKNRMMVGIEAGLNHPLFSIERIHELVKRIDSPYLGIIFDPTNLITVDTYKEQVTIVRQAFQRFGDQIVCLHLKDFTVENGEIMPVPLGEGIIQYEEILTILHQYKPYSYVVLEETKDASISKAVDLIKLLNHR